MATVAGPPVSLKNVRAVFGAPAGTRLSAFVRGGAWVPNNSSNGGVPLAPPIRLSDLAGATDAPPLSVTASPNPAIKSETGSAPTAIVTSPTVTASVSGGSGTYTYDWTASSSLTVSASGNKAFFSAELAAGDVLNASATCTVHDGPYSASVNVPITLSYFNPV